MASNSSDAVNFKQKIHQEINWVKATKLDHLPHVRRIKEYKQINYNDLTDPEIPLYDLDKSYERLYADYLNIKNTPLNLPEIRHYPTYTYPERTVQQIEKLCAKKYDLPILIDHEQHLLRSRSALITSGLASMNTDEQFCPFCRQELSEEADEVIDRYGEIVHQKTPQLYDEIENLRRHVLLKIRHLEYAETYNLRQITKFDHYKQKHLPSFADTQLQVIPFWQTMGSLRGLISLLIRKYENPDIYIEVDPAIKEELKQSYDSINAQIIRNGDLVEEMNKHIWWLDDEDLAARRALCMAVFNELKKGLAFRLVQPG
jgi:hypothetical protein